MEFNGIRSHARSLLKMSTMYYLLRLRLKHIQTEYTNLQGHRWRRLYSAEDIPQLSVVTLRQHFAADSGFLTPEEIIRNCQNMTQKMERNSKWKNVFQIDFEKPLIFKRLQQIKDGI